MSEPIAPTGFRLGIARGISYGLFGPPHEFIPQARALGAGLIRVYVYWNQVEPRPGAFDWSVLDAVLAQLDGDEELWVTVCASSLWATRTATDFLPPSPAHDPDAYERFVHALVRRARGRVQYWQCENEPSNTELLWGGTAAEYVAHLQRFHRAVRHADPNAAVVLGGCGYDALSSAPDGPARAFFDHVVDHGRDDFDLFALHLYDDPRRVPDHVATVRRMMRACGYERPVVVGEYNGPTLFEFPEVEGVLQQTMLAAFADGGGELSTSELAAQAATATPERRAMEALYTALPELPEALQMFMAGCPPELDELRDRINCREIVTRNLLAMAAGVHRTVCWHLAPEVANYQDPYTMNELMHGKLPLLAYEGSRLGLMRPAAKAFLRLAAELDGAVSVETVAVAEDPDVHAVAVERRTRPPVTVVWRDGDVLTGERTAPRPVEWRWTSEAAFAVDIFGVRPPLELSDGRLHVDVSVTPTFVTAEPKLR